MTKAQIAEREVDRLRLLDWIKPGDTVYTVLRHVSRSGMQRSISLLIMHGGEIVDISGTAAGALGDRFDRDRGGVKVGGCGMDMGFHLVYNLGRVLFPDGFECTGADRGERRCPSCDHYNGDRMYAAEHMHKDGGYALRHSWL